MLTEAQASALRVIRDRIRAEIGTSHPGHKVEVIGLVNHGWEVWCYTCDERIARAETVERKE